MNLRQTLDLSVPGSQTLAHRSKSSLEAPRPLYVDSTVARSRSKTGYNHQKYGFVENKGKSVLYTVPNIVYSGFVKENW